MTSDRITLP